MDRRPNFPPQEQALKSARSLNGGEYDIVWDYDHNNDKYDESKKSGHRHQIKTL